MDLNIILIGSMGLLFFWCVILTIMIAKEKQFFQNLAKGVTKKDLMNILRQITHSREKDSAKIEYLETLINDIQELDRHHFQKIGFLRFNPFADTGGDQSFCLCLLDQTNNGIVITSLHSRDTTRLYAKHITEVSLKDANLSQEETLCYQQAVSSKKHINK